MVEMMLHLFTDGSIGVLDYLLCIYTAFKTHRWMVGMQARLINCTLLSLQPTSHSPTHPSAFLFMNDIFPTKMQTFESNNEITISTTTLNCGEPLVLKLSVFLKIDKFEGTKAHSPFKWNIRVCLITGSSHLSTAIPQYQKLYSI